MTATHLAARRMDDSYFERAILDDGTPVVVRPIRPADAPFLQACVRELSERTRYLRFHGPRSDLSASELRYFTEVDGEQHFVLTAFTLPRPRLVGAACFIRGSVAAAAAEVALMIVDALQGKGLGQLLLSRLRDAALERSVTLFTGSMLEENRQMRGLLRKLGGRIGVPSRGVCAVELALT